MSKSYNICKVIREKDSSTLIGSSLIQIKSNDEKFKNYPPLTIYEGMCDAIDKLKNFKVYADDVLLCGYMRSGTTLMEEMIWLIVNDFDFQAARETIKSLRFPYFEGYNMRRSVPGNEDLPGLENFKRPRTMKTHAPVQFLPNEIYTVKPKIVYISRDVKDVSISMFHLLNDMGIEKKMSFEEFLKNFINDEMVFTPYREHCLNFKNFKYENILHLTYESVVGDMKVAILRVASFLGKEVSKENLELLMNHLKFDNMKNNKSCNNEDWIKKIHEMQGIKDKKTEGFIRKGRIGSHKEEMSQEWADKLDKWMKEIS